MPWKGALHPAVFFDPGTLGTSLSPPGFDSLVVADGYNPLSEFAYLFSGDSAHLHRFVFLVVDDDVDPLPRFAYLVSGGFAPLRKFVCPFFDGFAPLFGFVYPVPPMYSSDPHGCVHSSFDDPALPLPGGFAPHPDSVWSGPVCGSARCCPMACHFLYGTVAFLVGFVLRVCVGGTDCPPPASMHDCCSAVLAVSGFDSLPVLESVDLVSSIFQTAQHMSPFLFSHSLGSICFVLVSQFP